MMFSLERRTFLILLDLDYSSSLRIVTKAGAISANFSILILSRFYDVLRLFIIFFAATRVNKAK